MVGLTQNSELNTLDRLTGAKANGWKLAVRMGKSAEPRVKVVVPAAALPRVAVESLMVQPANW